MNANLISKNYSLIASVIRGDNQAVKDLLDDGADVNAIDSEQQTVLMMAVISRQFSLVKLLLERGADIYVQDSQGYTALHYAERLGDPEMVELLRQQPRSDSGSANDVKSNFQFDSTLLKGFEGLNRPKSEGYPSSMGSAVVSPTELSIPLSRGNNPVKPNSWQDAVSIGSIIGGVIFIGLVLTFNSSFTIKNSNNSSPNSTPQIISSSPYTHSNSSNSQVSLSIGWIRLGAVRNTSGKASVGEQLIATTQPVTIVPSVVPSIGDKVTMITGVNLRRSFPQYPNYKLPEKISVLGSGQKVVILKMETFIDQTSRSPYTVVWAEIGLPE